MVCDVVTGVSSGALAVVLAVVALMVVVGVWMSVGGCQAICITHPSYHDARGMEFGGKPAPL